jgi:hypothetical protein
MALSIELRRNIFRAGVFIFALNIVFYAIWQRESVRFAPCNGKAIGIELGLAGALLGLVLAMFGQGIRRWLLCLAAIVALYFWFSWIVWIGQMQC